MAAESEIKLTLRVLDEYANIEQLDRITSNLAQDLRGFEIESIETPHESNQEEGTRGDPITVGAVLLAVAPAVLPAIIAYLKEWSINGRTVEVETADGVKVKFTPEKKYTEREIISLVKKLSQASGKKSKKK